MRVTRRQLRRIIREERRRILREQDETGGGSVATIKKGLALAFPDWASDIEGLDLKSSFVDEFAALVKNAMTAAESGKLVKAATASEKTTAAIE